jgi:hypothetical protein
MEYDIEPSTTLEFRDLDVGDYFRRPEGSYLYRKYSVFQAYNIDGNVLIDCALWNKWDKVIKLKQINPATFKEE